MKLVVAADHAGLALKAALVAVATELKHEVNDLGTHEPKSVDYPDYAKKLAAEIIAGRAQAGVLVCGTGIGMSITANRFKGVRAALCHTEFEARMARTHNDANVLCLGERVTGPGLARAILETFLATGFEGGRHQQRVEKIEGGS